MNGVDKETLKGMSLDDKINGLIDMVYEIGCQPQICGAQFVKRVHVWIAVAFISGVLIAKDYVDFRDIVELIK